VSEDKEANLERALGRMEGKVDLLLLHFDEVKDRVEGHEGRIGALERALSEARAYAIVGAFVIATGVPIALKFFGLA
jgi:hypothetical protein